MGKSVGLEVFGLGSIPVGSGYMEVSFFPSFVRGLAHVFLGIIFFLVVRYLTLNRPTILECWKTRGKHWINVENSFTHSLSHLYKNP